MIVSEIMTRNLKTVTPDTPMASVVADMCLYRISGMPVIEGDNTLVGFVAEKDVLHHLFPSLEDSMNIFNVVDFEAMEDLYKGMMGLTVNDLMTRKAITVSPDMPILKATSIMVRHRFRRIPVASGDKLLGMLSLGDVHKALFKKAVTAG
ncbi:MAG TPA: CBS domain-containing protein [Thiobacillaceae bacterium]|nr:CBS domain-containing protein [Thiobacillaceae bacterium]